MKCIKLVPYVNDPEPGWWSERDIIDWTPHVLAQEFPYMKDVVSREIEKLQRFITIFTPYPKCIFEYDIELCLEFHQKGNIEHAEIIFFDIFRKSIIEDKRKNIENIIRKYKSYLQLISYSPNKFSAINNERVNFQNKISIAKQYPIDQLIDFNRAGFSLCIWHNEKTGSMKYNRNTNTVYCYGCNKYGDVIDVVREIAKVSFVEAVKRLS